MIARIDKSGTNLELDADVTRYIDRKIGRLDRYMPRAARKTAHATVVLRETGNQSGSKYECEAIIRLPGETIAARESTLNKFAAIDIVEAKLKNQLHKYKTTHIQHIKGHHGGFLRRMRQRFFASAAESEQ
jgi:ribosomal subunit interface protein